MKQRIIGLLCVALLSLAACGGDTLQSGAETPAAVPVTSAPEARPAVPDADVPAERDVGSVPSSEEVELVQGRDTEELEEAVTALIEAVVDLQTEQAALRNDLRALESDLSELETGLFGVTGPAIIGGNFLSGIEGDVEDLGFNQSAIVDYINCLTDEFRSFCSTPFLR